MKYAIFDEYGFQFPDTERDTQEDAEALRQERVAAWQKKWDITNGNDGGSCVGMYDDAKERTEAHQGVTYVTGWRSKKEQA